MNCARRTKKSTGRTRHPGPIWLTWPERYPPALGRSDLNTRSTASAVGAFLLSLGPSPSVLAFVALVVGALVWAGWDATGTPAVVYAWPWGECLRVEYSDGHEGSCDALPAHYDVVWEGGTEWAR